MIFRRNAGPAVCAARWCSVLLVLTLGCTRAHSPAPQGEAPPATPDLAAVLATSTLIDLTHTFDAGTLVWPTSDPFRLETVFDGTTPGGWHYASNNVHTTEHGGTHLDAPIHFAAGRQSTEQVPLSRLVRPAVVVDVSTWMAQDRDGLVTIARLTQWEAQHGPIAPDTIVLLRTGYSVFWPDAERYLGTALRGDAGVQALHFPGLDPAAANWLVQDRKIAAVGIDTASIDRGQSTTFEAHRALAAANVPIFENLTALDQLPTRGSVVLALPMKIGGGSGGPLRAVALVPR